MGSEMCIRDRMEMDAMRMVMDIPGVSLAVTNIGRGESPADSQSQNESTPMVSLKPRNQWPEGWTQATNIYEGERRFSASVRLPEDFRNSIEAIDAILLTSPNGARIPLGDLANISLNDGPSQISREMGKRRIVIGINARDRDLGSFVAELQKTVSSQIKLPEAYYLEWGGQFQNMERALGHLKIIIPITIGAIFFVLFMLFNSLRFAALIILVLPFASIGDVVSLFITGEYLSVPASVGFIALWGIAVLNGVVLVSCIRNLRSSGLSQIQAIREGCAQCFRPVMMTATVALLGLVPFLFATGPGFRSPTSPGYRCYWWADHVNVTHAGYVAYAVPMV